MVHCEFKTFLTSIIDIREADQVPGHLSQRQLEVVEIVRQNGIELQRLIENLIEESLMTSSNPPPPVRSGPPVAILAALFVGVLALIGGVLFFIFSG